MLNEINLVTYQKEVKLGMNRIDDTPEFPSTHPFLATADNNELYICKMFEENGNLPVINEYVCYLLAKEFQLPLEEAALFRISEDVINTSPDLQTRDIKSKLGFGLKWNKKANANIRPVALENCKNIDIIPTLLYFDQLILNNDRALNDGNLLFDAKQRKLIVIDHSHTFGLGEIWDHATLNQSRSKWLIDNFNGKYYNMLSSYIRGNNPFSHTLILANQLSAMKIMEIINSIPEEWQLDDQRKSALIDFLIFRNDHVNDIINAIKPNCPYWKGGRVSQ